MKKVLGLITITLLASLLSPVHAASPFGNRADEPDLSNTYHPPRLYIDKFQLTEQNQQKIKGSFVLQNDEDYPINGNYRLELLGIVPEKTRKEHGIPDDTTIQYYRGPANEAPTLAPHAEQLLSFELTLPSLPAGDYTLRVQALSNTGRPLGWGDLTITYTNNDPSFVYLYPGKIQIPEYKDTLEPLTGPNVSPTTAFKIYATAENLTTQRQRLTPRLTMYQFDPARTRHDVVTLPPITVNAGQSLPLTIPVKAPAQPYVYFAVLELVDQANHVHSTIADYRWVVRGANADIFVAAPVAFDAANKLIEIKVEYVGPADAETYFKGNVEIILADKNGILGSQTSDQINFSDAIGGGTATIALQRTPHEFLSIATAIKNDKKETILERTEKFPVTSLPASQTVQRNRLILVIVSAVVMVVAVAGLAYLHLKKRRRRK